MLQQQQQQPKHQQETQKKPQSSKRLLYHQIWVLLLTFSAYAAFHASRKPPSIVKPALSSALNGWAPFAGPTGPHRLGELDLAFLATYSVGMYFSGHLADRIPLRLFLVSGMLGSAVFTVAFGLGFWFRIHTLPYFLAVQIACGLFQSVGWPCVVSIVGNWFGKSKRGLIMGIWNSHTSVGNVVGSVLASSVLDFGWGWSFVLPGFLLLLVALAVSRFLVACPQDVGLEIPPGDHQIPDSVSMELVDSVERHSSEKGVVLESSSSEEEEEEEEEEAKAVLIDNISHKRLHLEDSSSEAIGFLEAWRLPDVAPFAFSLFFSKLVAYTFLYWLPFYISHTAVAGVHLSHKTAGILSTIFDVGGVLGGILAGYISDKIEARGVTSIMFLLLSIPALIVYRMFGNISMMMNIGLMFISGLLVNGPYSLITTAVAADLGTQSLIKGNSRALATVTAIIDGTGSVGAALGPLMAGYISTRGWNSVFFMLILSILLAGLMLIQIAKTEIKGKFSKEISIGST